MPPLEELALRTVSSCLSIVVDLDAAAEEVAWRWELSKQIAKHSKLFLEGKISGGDLLDLVEAEGLDIDQYVEEVEDNLEAVGFLR